MHPADIKAELQKAGSSCARVADEAEVKRSTVSKVVNGQKRSRKVAFIIAAKLGKPAHQVWPGQYAAKVARNAAQRRAIKRAVRPRK